MNRKVLTIILAIALLAGFFLPWSSGFVGSFSGFDLVKAPGAGWEQYILLLIPLAAVLLLIGAMNNNYVLGRGLLSWLPLLTILFMLIGIPLINGIPIKYIFQGLGKNFGVGLWITIVASLVLAFYNPKE